MTVWSTIEPNVGSTNVPDKRLEVLTEICQPKRTIPATVEIVDIAGLVKGASKGEGLGNQFLANIRETGSFYTESDAKNANAQILNYNIQNIVPVMMQDAKVKDNRARFF